MTTQRNGFVFRMLFFVILLSFLGFSGCGKENWIIYESEHFLIRARSKEIAQRNAEALEGYALPFLVYFFEKENANEPHSKFQIDVLKDRKAQEANLKGAFGSYSPNDKKLTYGYDEENFPQTAFHEFTHMYVHQIVFHGDTVKYMRLPGWIDEGFATFMETLAAYYRAKQPLANNEGEMTLPKGLVVPDYRVTEVREDVRKGRVWPSSKIVSLEERSKLGNQELGYSWSIVAFGIVHLPGQIPTIIKRYQSLSPQEKLKLDFSNYEEAWKAWLVQTLSESGKSRSQ